jgi:alkylhydroperoxidase family enzyme
MTWLPIPTDAPTERDAVLGLHPEAYARLKATLAASAASVDERLLDPCRVRMAQMLGCREELARHSAEHLAQVEAWDTAPAFDDRQRAALAFTEQFVMDPARISAELAGALEAAIGTEKMVDFATTLSHEEASLRLSTLFDLEPAR